MADEIITSAGSPAPDSSPAASATSGEVSAQPSTAGAVGGGEVSPTPSASAPVEKFLDMPDPGLDPEGYSQRFENLTDEEADLFAEGRVKYSEKPKEAEKPAATAPVEAQPQEQGNPTLSKEEFEKLPPRAQAAIQAAQKQLDEFGELGPLLQPEARQELDQLLGDPRVRQVVEQRARGEKLTFDEKTILTPQNIGSIMQKAGIDLAALDGISDPATTQQAIAKVVAVALQEGLDAGKLRAQIDHSNELRSQEVNHYFESELKSLVSGFDELKSDLHHNDPKHPANGFVSFLKESLGKGHISYDFLKNQGEGALKGQYIAWRATQKGGIGALLKAPQANQRMQILEDLAQAATREAVNTANRTPSSAPVSSIRTIDGVQIDGQKYLTDIAYRDWADDQVSSSAGASALAGLAVKNSW